MVKQATEQEIFEHYITDPAMLKRERRYMLQYAILCALYLTFVLYCYYDFPMQRIVGVPLFCILVWIFNATQYFAFVWNRGGAALGLKGDKLGGWETIEIF
ncbi:hypothetical protein AGMMS49983_10240 [Clostridia bacterium]|nr:hypothetical protein AGMMS49983_10240 [Clostridia bacterium]